MMSLNLQKIKHYWAIWILLKKPLTRANPQDPDFDELNSDTETDQNAGQHWIMEKPFRPVAEYL